MGVYFFSSEYVHCCVLLILGQVVWGSTFIFHFLGLACCFTNSPDPDAPFTTIGIMHDHYPSVCFRGGDLGMRVLFDSYGFAVSRPPLF